MKQIHSGYLVAGLVMLAVAPSACGRRSRAAKHPTSETAQAAPAPEPETAQKCHVKGPAYAVPAPGPIASAGPAQPAAPPTPPGGVPLTPAPVPLAPARSK